MPAILTHDAAMRRTAGRLLTRARGRPVQVIALRREPNIFAGVFPSEVLTVGLRGGGTVRLFVKHLGPEQADHPEKQQRDRELRVYAELLAEPGLPVARCLGWRRHRPSGRCDLYLEHIDDWSLRYQELRYWVDAARALARLHAHFAERGAWLRRRAWLLPLDAPYFRDWAARAVAAARAESPALGAALAPAVRDYDVVAGLLAAQPPTLVHNDLAPKNVIVDRTATPALIRIVDWEMAGVGCGLLDLVDLACGLSDADARRMRDAYAAELEGTGILPADAAGRERLLAAGELHRALYRIAFARRWGVDGDRVAGWIREACRLRSAIADGAPLPDEARSIACR